MPIQRGVRFVPQRPKPADGDDHLIVEKIAAEFELKGDERVAAEIEIERVMEALRRTAKASQSRRERR
jgi:hypothetical protein